MPENEAIHATTCHPIQSMTNAVKNSSSRSTTSFPVFGVLRRFLYEQLIETTGHKIHSSGRKSSTTKIFNYTVILYSTSHGPESGTGDDLGHMRFGKFVLLHGPVGKICSQTVQESVNDCLFWASVN